MNCHKPEALKGRNPHLDINAGTGCEFCHAERPVPGRDTIETVKFVADPNILCLRCHSPPPHPASFEHTLTVSAERAATIPRELPVYRGGKVVCGEGQDLLDSLDRSVSYSLVVLGDLFVTKGHAARLRMTRELQRFLSDHITAPVVSADELKAQYLFGRRDTVRLAGFLVLVATVYLLVFSNQKTILNFLSGEWQGGRVFGHILVAAAVFAFVPFLAHCYGTVAKSLMKLIKME